MVIIHPNFLSDPPYTSVHHQDMKSHTGIGWNSGIVASDIVSKWRVSHLKVFSCKSVLSWRWCIILWMNKTKRKVYTETTTQTKRTKFSVSFIYQKMNEKINFSECSFFSVIWGTNLISALRCWEIMLIIKWMRWDVQSFWWEFCWCEFSEENKKQ